MFDLNIEWEKNEKQKEKEREKKIRETNIIAERSMFSFLGKLKL